MITETASAPEGGDTAAWVKDMFASLGKYPRIAAVVCFDVDKERDWRAEATAPPTSATVWAAETNAASNWLHGKYTPRSIRPQKTFANRAVSLVFAVS